MPVKKCSVQGEKGYKYGDSGKCYLGEDAKEKATKQGQAIHASQNKKKKG